MPSPVAHSLAGGALALVTRRQAPPSWKNWQWGLLLVVLANAPDLDFLPGLFVGEPSVFHRNIGSHSLVAALAAGALAGAVLRVKSRARFGACFLVAAAAYASHLLLDVFSGGPQDATGVLLYWPFSEQPVLSPQPLFLSITKSSETASFVQSLFSAHNAQAMLREVVVLAPVVALAAGWVWLKRRHRRRPSSR